MRRIFAIDPGCIDSGYVIIDENLKVYEKGNMKNSDLLAHIVYTHHTELVIEMFASYGMPVGKSSFDTVLFIGSLVDRSYTLKKRKPVLMTRGKIKHYLCGSSRAKDKNVNAAIKDHFAPTGGGADPYKGVKSKKGPLYGFSSHTFAALGVAIAYLGGADHYVISSEMDAGE